ncbi:hypothetical protein [Calothrix sp. PCC 7507]|uniref:hypothetical protein n=1 Tax=Calothrix sp. PCC 7507 TaxID=99598 RepID=UPI00029F1130|nr:hypothetical protein [Calothrix sp. PCC 7507]AFY30986.1 hypothetical protein Cal7507_0491 [Calothrix sp. PCC 7507]
MPIELKQFRKNLIYEVKAPVSNVIAELQEISSLDKLAEIQQKKYGKQALYCFLAAVASIVLIFITSFLITDNGLLGLVGLLLLLASIGLIIAGIYALVKRAKFGRLNISNYRYEIAKKVLQMLARDMDKSNEVELRLSFKKIGNKEHKTETIPHPQKSGWKIDKHQHAWLEVKGQFLDKTRFAIAATGISKTQYGWKRGRSGKHKYKTKTKSLGLDVILNLTYPQRRYGAVKILQPEIGNAVKLPKLSYMKGLEVGEKSMYMNVRMAPQVEDNQEEIYQTITMMFLSLYQVLNLAKLLSK